jgi:hypothetical protein
VKSATVAMVTSTLSPMASTFVTRPFFHPDINAGLFARRSISTMVTGSSHGDNSPCYQTTPDDSG